MQVAMAISDNICCNMNMGVIFEADGSEKVLELLNAAYGIPVNPEILGIIGQQTISWEKEFNKKAGFTPKDNVMPSFVREEKLEMTEAIFDVDPLEMENI